VAPRQDGHPSRPGLRSRNWHAIVVCATSTDLLVSCWTSCHQSISRRSTSTSSGTCRCSVAGSRCCQAVLASSQASSRPKKLLEFRRQHANRNLSDARSSGLRSKVCTPCRENQEQGYRRASSESMFCASHIAASAHDGSAALEIGVCRVGRLGTRVRIAPAR
jgi:hypothetical protein